VLLRYYVPGNSLAEQALHDCLADSTADRRRAGGLEGTRCPLAAADWPLLGTGPVRVVPTLTLTALQAGEGLLLRTVVVEARRGMRLQSFAVLRHRISQGQWRTLVTGVPEAMPNSLNSSPGSFEPKGLWERYGGAESSNRMGFYISVVEWLSTSKVPRLMG